MGGSAPRRRNDCFTVTAPRQGLHQGDGLEASDRSLLRTSSHSSQAGSRSHFSSMPAARRAAKALHHGQLSTSESSKSCSVSSAFAAAIRASCWARGMRIGVGSHSLQTGTIGDEAAVAVACGAGFTQCQPRSLCFDPGGPPIVIVNLSGRNLPHRKHFSLIYHFSRESEAVGGGGRGIQ